MVKLHICDTDTADYVLIEVINYYPSKTDIEI